MNIYLKNAVERYPVTLDSALIHPVSQQDAAIISELIELFSQLNAPAVTTLLNQYKFLKDSETLQRLQDIRAALKTDKPATDSKKPVNPFEALFIRSWIYFKGVRLELNDIHCYETIDEYKPARGGMEYQIVINLLPETTAVRYPTTHKVIRYDNIEQRDADFKALDTWVSSQPNIHFINDRDE